MKIETNVIPFPGVATPHSWVSGNPDVFFVGTENTHHRCSACGKRIVAGTEYYGARKMALRFSGNELVSYSVSSQRVSMRLHQHCARAIK